MRIYKVKLRHILKALYRSDKKQRSYKRRILIQHRYSFKCSDILSTICFKMLLKNKTLIIKANKIY